MSTRAVSSSTCSGAGRWTVMRAFTVPACANPVDKLNQLYGAILVVVHDGKLRCGIGHVNVQRLPL